MLGSQIQFYAPIMQFRVVCKEKCLGVKPKVSLKPRGNDRNMPTQHIATLLGATCCVRLATVLRLVGCYWLKFDIFKLEPTTPNMSQHGGQTIATCCAQRCYDILRWHVAIVWLGLERHFRLLSISTHRVLIKHHRILNVPSSPRRVKILSSIKIETELHKFYLSVFFFF